MLEERTNPAKFEFSLLSPLAGEMGDSGATHSGSLALANTLVTASSATEAVMTAFSGSISATGMGTYTFSAANVGADKPYQIESSGEQFAIAMEDMAGQTGCDWDYNDRVWLMLVRDVSTQSVVYTNSFPWTDPYSPSTSATVTVTVTANVPGHEGRYLWNYQLANQSFNSGSDGVGIFSLTLPELGGIEDISSSLGWYEGFGAYGGPNVLSWYVDDFLPRIATGGSADFSFTSPVCGIGDTTGEMADGGFAMTGGGQVQAPALVIRSVTLWGQPGAPDPFGAAIGGMVGASGTVLGANPNLGGGKRIFPEMPKPNSAKSFENVDVRVELSQPVAQAKNVNMYQFDVDDPSTDNFLVDAEFRSLDNRTQSLDEAVNASFTITVDAGEASGKALRRVSRQPGDNNRFVGTIDNAVTLGTDVKIWQHVDVVPFPPYPFWPPVPGFLLINADFYLSYGDGVRAGVYHSGGTGNAVAEKNDKTVTSTLLTVWRTLHVERDVMDAPTPAEPFAGAGNVIMPNTAEGTTEGDDDVPPDGMSGTIPKPGIGLMQQNYRAAYIEVVADLAAYNTHNLTPFVHNMDHKDLTKWNPAKNIRDVPCGTTEKFWTIQIIGGYESRTDEDQDGPDAAGTVSGITDEGIATSYVFTEVVRDTWQAFGPVKKAAMPLTAFTERITFHESLHVFGFKHFQDFFADEGPLDSGLNRNGTDDDQKLTPGQLGVIRSRPGPGRR